jgi:ABC-2 type transport system permease protein
MTGEIILAIGQREFDTVIRTRLMAVLAAAYILLSVGIAVLVSSGSYVGLVLDTLVPTEALVTVLVFAMGYRTVVADRERGELDRLRTYPLSRARYIAGIYLGRAVPVVAAVLLAFAGSGAIVALSGGEGASIIATHATADSPLLFIRYAVLTVAFALVGLAVAILVSAAARSSRAALALTAVAVLALLLGLDAGLIGVLTGGIVSPDGLTWLLAVSPNSAYRALVLELCVAPIGASIPAGPAVLPSALGLILWIGVSLTVASRLAWR